VRGCLLLFMQSCGKLTGVGSYSALQQGFWGWGPKGKPASHVAVKSLTACYMMQATWQML